jgi:2-iminobutanoate/2-iminopropanoate deaminase
MNITKTKRFVTTFLAFATLLPAADKRVIHPRGVPTGRPFSPAILADGTLYVSGQTGTNPGTGQTPSQFDAEVRQCFSNIEAILKEAGMEFKDVVSVQVYLTDMDTFEEMNKIYATYFAEPRPARTTVGVARLAGKARIEITVTARK